MIKDLPEFYRRYISKFDKNIEVEYSDEVFRLKSLEGLYQEVNVDGNTTPFWKQWESWIKTYRELSGEDNATLLTYDEEEISFNQLLNCIVIGEDQNGDIIYIDPNEGNSVWKHYHDGADLELISEDIQEFIENSKLHKD